MINKEHSSMKYIKLSNISKTVCVKITKVKCFIFLSGLHTGCPKIMYPLVHDIISSINGLRNLNIVQIKTNMFSRGGQKVMISKFQWWGFFLIIDEK